MEYEHVQWGRLTPLVSLYLLAMTAIVVLATGSIAALALLAAFDVAMITVVVWFSRLIVTVSGGSLVLRFGWGRPRKEVSVDRIRHVSQTRTKWWYGFGIRRVPRGWMWNVWGLDVVEVVLDDGKIMWVGTDDSDNLTAVLSLLRR